ncbi:MAG TPA: hypothetical protein VIF57_06425 [Polyangia bacterium]
MPPNIIAANRLKNRSQLTGELPLIFAGPILRHVDSGSVTVWVALGKASNVKLEIFDGSTLVMSTNAQPAQQIGTNLFVALITADGNAGTLSTRKIYHYNLTFSGGQVTGDLTEKGIVIPTGSLNDPKTAISYDSSGLPSFILPAPTAEELRIVHGSCRKPHGESIDTLATLNAMLTTWAGDAAQRPQQLFMTGDQIYADEVAQIMLALIVDAAAFLFDGAPELLPNQNPGEAAFDSSRWGPDSRKPISDGAGFTTGSGHNHLLTFQEYAAMYVLAYSNAVWPALVQLPAASEVFPNFLDDGLQRTFDKQMPAIRTFVRTLPEVRRALANIPTYMILDDHDITDDFYMNGEFCARVIGSTDRPSDGTVIGRRILQNALAAYAVFQGWGNVKDLDGGSGDVAPVVDAVVAWAGDDYQLTSPKLDDVAKAVGMPAKLTPPAAGATTLARLQKPPEAVKWFYHHEWDAHELFVLDSRTVRSYPNAPLQNPAIIDEATLTDQIPPTTADKVAFVVTTKPIVTLPDIEKVQKDASNFDEVFARELEVWRFEPTAMESLLSALAARGNRNRKVVIISGDMHHGFAYRYQYWADVALADPTGGAAAAVFALFTSSPFKNETARIPFSFTAPIESFKSDYKTTRFVHENGFHLSVFGSDIGEASTILTWIADPQDLTRSSKTVGTQDLFETPPFGGPDELVGTSDLVIPRNRKVHAELDFREKVFETNKTKNLHINVQPSSIAIATFQHSTQVRAAPPFVRKDTAPTLADKVAATQNQRLYVTQTGDGSACVGVNHIGLIRFQTFEDPAGSGKSPLHAVQELWWRQGQAGQLYNAENSNALQPATALSMHPISLEIETKPTLP